MKQGKLFLDSLAKPFRSRSYPGSDGGRKQEEVDLETITAHEQRLFSYSTLAAATLDFHPKNKLGEGGFGPVYKGTLEGGRVVAVKKLSQSSSQGKKEFMNEAKLLARVQHRNVVNLLGYCVHDTEKILVYEYIAHESLDKFLFDARKRDLLYWKRRFDIIMGVARGLVYLHQDAHSRIIHRDIKASNILLDDKWMPKIADFGMARLFPEDQTHVNTRVAGTNGYMAPEYLMHGRLSEKADVFSFGVVVLELVCGKKNSTFGVDSAGQITLLGWVWSHYRKGQSLKVIDPSLASTDDMEQVAMCIQIGLLCCQADPGERPTMDRVVVMLSKKPGTLEEPGKPGNPGSRYRRSHPSGSLSTSSIPTSSSSDSFKTGGESSRAASSSSSRAASSSNTVATPTKSNSTFTLSPKGPLPPAINQPVAAHKHKHKLKDDKLDSS